MKNHEFEMMVAETLKTGIEELADELKVNERANKLAQVMVDKPDDLVSRALMEPFATNEVSSYLVNRNSKSLDVLGIVCVSMTHDAWFAMPIGFDACVIKALREYANWENPKKDDLGECVWYVAEKTMEHLQNDLGFSDAAMFNVTKKLVKSGNIDKELEMLEPLMHHVRDDLDMKIAQAIFMQMIVVTAVRHVMTWAATI